MKHANPDITIHSLRLTMVVLLSLLLVISCKKGDPDLPPDICGEEFVGEFRLLEDSRISIPYLENRVLYFKDADGRQAKFEFLFGDGGYKLESMSASHPCQFDSSRMQVKIASVDGYQFFINEVTEFIQMKFMLDLIVNPFFQDTIAVSDQLTISVAFDLQSPDYAKTLTLLVSQRDLPIQFVNLFPKPIEEVVLIDKTFYNVFTNSDFSFFYNNDLGIIALKDKNKHLWVLDKTEK
ncbi:MAG: hypothetical protein CVT99_10490 [Bacteroidetes bacterium HGW-Bacteroidetes-16]|jgi:hypothetical protein|nr:MAG: hypothetical protein CVT99_10490 [Bacteroidetes bacterium HGW-Bacteroidetes-16]